MTTYTAIAESETDPGAAGTSSLWKRWAKNWIAGFEGAVGAPRLAKAALSGLFIGTITSLTTTWAGLTGLDSYEELSLNFSNGPGPTTSSFAGVSIRFSNDGGATWGAAQNLILYSPGATSASSLTGSAIVNLRTGAFAAQGLGMGTASPNSVIQSNGTLTVPANCNGIQVRGILSSTTCCLVSVFGGRA